jgi:ROK family protein (putative glucokinase)
VGYLCFGIDIGGTSIKAGLFRDNGELLDKWSFATIKKESSENILRSLADFILDKIETLSLNKKEIVGIGVGIPGPVTEEGEVLEMANLGSGRINLNETLSKMTGLKVRAGNDANLAALGEQWMGSGKGCKDMMLITLGTGIGGGIVLNNRILTGNKGAAGEIGHMTVNSKERRVCGCGKRGCLEQYASATAVVRIAQDILEERTEASALRDSEKISARDVFDCAKTGDKLALEVVDQACSYLGMALSYAGQLIDPEVFVIGGGVSQAGSIIVDKTKESYHNNVIESLKNKEIRIASLGNDAGMYGAAKLILSSL